jgi:hypothetical protein
VQHALNIKSGRGTADALLRACDDVRDKVGRARTHTTSCVCAVLRLKRGVSD